MWWRRRSQRSSHEVVAAPRVERALVTLACHAQQLDDRVDQLERRLDASLDASLDAPTQDDLLDVRLHSARVGAELARLAVELRAEIEQVRNAIPAPSAADRRIRALAEGMVDLSDRLDTLPTDVIDTREGRGRGS